jgi:hypothetical protein
MVQTILDAKVKLEAERLYVSSYREHSLWIAGTTTDIGDGIKLSKDACVLIQEADRWLVAFPADGMLSYEVPGTLPELLSLITTVYSRYRQTGGPFQEAVKRTVPDAEHYLIGRSLSKSNGEIIPEGQRETRARP